MDARHEDELPVSVSWTRVRPRHCDAQAMVHAIRYYEFFEDAFLEWLDRFVGGYPGLRAQGADLVIVENGCRYGGSARLDDLLEIEVVPTRAGRTSVSLSFTVRRAEPEPAAGRAARRADPLVVGRATYVAVANGRSVPLPERLRAALRHVPVQTTLA